MRMPGQVQTCHTCWSINRPAAIPSIEGQKSTKLVHISDIHIDPKPILGIDPVSNFKACIDHVAEFQSDADRVVITGDLTHHGLRESYELLRDMLDQSPLKNGLAPRLLIGNHDDRDIFRSVFPEAAADHNGHVQWYE